MVLRCSVLNCKSRDKTLRKFTLFSVPADPILNKLWNNVVSKINNKVTVVKKVCELHFTNDDLVRSYVNWPDDVSDHQRIIPKLLKGAVPSLFGNAVFDDCSEITPVRPQFGTQIPLCYKKLDKTFSTSIDSSIDSNCSSLKIQAPLSDDNSSFHKNFRCFNNSDNHQIKELQFIKLFKQLKSISLPTGWSCIQNETTLVFFSMQIQNDVIPKATVEKQIVILHNFQVLCYALNTELKPSSFDLKSFEVGLNNIEQVVNLLMLFDKKSICIGGPKAINFSGISVKSAILIQGTWHHYNCTIVIDALNFNRCKQCQQLFATFRVYKSRYTCPKVKKVVSQTLATNRRRSMSNIVKQKDKLQESNTRLNKTIHKINNILENLQKKMENKTYTTRSIQRKLILKNV